MGSTPEIILSGEKNEWSTVALAGTQPLQDGRLPQEWGEKNRQEQDYVASYIRRQLLSSGIHPTESGPYPAYAGAPVSYTHLFISAKRPKAEAVRPAVKKKILSDKQELVCSHAAQYCAV